MPHPDIPSTMQALLLKAYHDDLAQAIAGLQVVSRPVPVPRRGQVLIKIEAAACNPSDLLFLQNKYGGIKTLPSVPGWEGCGTVVSSGGGLYGRWLVGQRVACALQTDRDGTWAQYFVANNLECIPLQKTVSDEQAAGLIINPLTAMGLLHTARRQGHRAAVHTAAASQLGRMLLALAKDLDFPIIHVVRREEQADLLRSAGASHVINSSMDDFEQELKELCALLKATVGFEAVAGELTGTVLNALPPGATVYVYGALSEEACGGIDPVEIIFREKTLTGFYLGKWLGKRNPLSILRMANRVQRWITAGVIQTAVQRNLPLSEATAGLQHYVDHMTDGKVLMRPDR